MFTFFAAAFGSILFALGLLSFIPETGTADIDGSLLLFGVFSVDVIQNIIHLATGVIGLFAASSQRYARWFLQIFGTAYIFIALIGWLQGDSVLGLFGVNAAVNVLHAALGIVMVGLGLLRPKTLK